MDFVKKMEENSHIFSEKKALSSGDGAGYTYSQVWDISGKIYAYLKSKGIGREDFVMVKLPRGAETIIACIGVWRAGAAFVIVEEGYPKERTGFIYGDCGCVLEIDRETYEDVLKMEALSGYEKVDDHDAAYACYTSGTTGEPKGVLHEYGVIEQCRYSYYYKDEYELLSTDRYAMLSPLNFVAVLIVFPSLLYVGGELVIVPLETVKNTEKLKELFIKEHITVTFITPTFLRVFYEFNPELRMLYLASETAKNIYFDNLELFNVHAQSETGFLTTTFKIDKEYDVTPIGKTFIPGLELCLITDMKTVAKSGEMGEICFKNIYFRGYINNPELTKEAFRDGIYHTGDIGRLLPDGNIVLLGRSDDMVKINGNRVEPAEIENVLKNVMKVEWAAIRCISHKGKIIIAAYYIDEPCISIAEVKSIVEEKLPYYMVPSHYIQIDTIPVNANGKFSRKNLPEPDFNTAAAYAAPRDEMERRLTNIFSQVLSIEDVGIDDDFYELGGDSLQCIQIVSAADIQELSAEIIFRERTIRKIAASLRKNVAEHNADREQEAQQIAQEGCELSPYQKFFYERQKSMGRVDDAYMFNTSVLMKYSEKTDADRLAEATEAAISAHPMMMSKIIFRGNRAVQVYDESQPKVEVECLSDAEFEKNFRQLMKYIDVEESKLYISRVIKTPSAAYLFLELHHIISDGTSIHLLLKDIYKAYMGEQIEKDYIYLYLKRVEEHRRLPYYEECGEYYERNYGHKEWSQIPEKDHKPVNYYMGTFEQELNIDEAGYNAIKEKYRINHNAFYLAVTLLAMAKYNGVNKVCATWTYHGRDTRQKNSMVGPLIKDLPVFLELRTDYIEGENTGIENVAELFEEINSQIKEGIARSPYPFSFIGDNSYENDRICFLYQREIYDFDTDDELHGRLMEMSGNREIVADNSFNVQVFSRGRKYFMEIDYLKEAYDIESVHKFADFFDRIAKELVEQKKMKVGDIII